MPGSPWQRSHSLQLERSNCPFLWNRGKFGRASKLSIAFCVIADQCFRTVPQPRFKSAVNFDSEQKVVGNRNPWQFNWLVELAIRYGLAVRARAHSTSDFLFNSLLNSSFVAAELTDILIDESTVRSIELNDEARFSGFAVFDSWRKVDPT